MYNGATSYLEPLPALRVALSRPLPPPQLQPLDPRPFQPCRMVCTCVVTVLTPFPSCWHIQLRPIWVVTAVYQRQKWASFWSLGHCRSTHSIQSDWKWWQSWAWTWQGLATWNLKEVPVQVDWDIERGRAVPHWDRAWQWRLVSCKVHMIAVNNCIDPQTATRSHLCTVCSTSRKWRQVWWMNYMGCRTC